MVLGEPAICNPPEEDTRPTYKCDESADLGHYVKENLCYKHIVARFVIHAVER